MEQAVILSAVRTPIGRYNGGLKDVRPDDLAALTIALDRTLVELGLHAFARLVAGGLFGALSYALALRFIDAASVQELLALLRRRREQRRATAEAPSATP